MAVQEQTPQIEYVANGVTKSFPLTFDCEDQDHLIVTVNDAELSVGSWMLIDENVSFKVAPANGSNIVIQRNTPLQRTTTYQTYNNSFRPGPVNKDLDRIWWKLQELGLADWLLSKRLDKEIQDRILADLALKADYILRDSKLKEDYISRDKVLEKDYIQRDVALKKYIDSMIALVTGDPSFSGIDASMVGDPNGLNQKEINDGLDCIADMLKIKHPNNGDRVYVKGYSKPTNLALATPYMGGGEFIYDSSKSTKNDSVVVFYGWVRQHKGSLDVTDGGAVPDTSAPQHTEIKRTFEACRWNKIPSLTMRTGVYLVGDVTKDLGTLFDVWGISGVDTHPQDNFTFDGCGATIKQVDGVMFGMHSGVNRTPFEHIFQIQACHNVRISNLYIDGNKQNANVGGKSGDHGWQRANYGVRAISAIRAQFSNVVISNMLLDGWYFGRMKGFESIREDIVMLSCHGLYNTRQAISVCGVRGLTAIGCNFNYTGQNGLMSAPAAGIDFENELGDISDVSLFNCEIRGNMGNDIHIFNLKAEHQIRDITLNACTIVAEGKTEYPFGSQTPADNKCSAIEYNIVRNLVFNDCLIGGRVKKTNGGTNWQYHSKVLPLFNNCTLTDEWELLNRSLEAPVYKYIIDTVSPDGTEYGLRLSGGAVKVKNQMVRIPRFGRISNVVFELSFSKKLESHAVDFGTSSVSNTDLYTFDNQTYRNTVNYGAWANTTNTVTSNDAPDALMWSKVMSTGRSGDISVAAPVVLSGGNLDNAFIKDNRVFTANYVLRGVFVNSTYPEVWGTATFIHSGNGEGMQQVNATNYNGMRAIRVRNSSEGWGAFSTQ